MQIRNWLQSPSSLTHGNIIKREIFSKKDPDNPDKEGAILNYVDSFSRCYLEPRIASVPAAFDDRQLIFYVVDGQGVFEAGDVKQDVQEGDGIIVPPGLTHTLTNEANAPLEFLILEEVLPDGVEASRKDALIRNYRESTLGQGHWTHLVHPIFSQDDGLVTMHSVLVVRIEAMQTPDTHGHDDNMDEVWYMLEGNGIHVVSQNVYRQRPGDAVSVAPSSPGHTLINDTDEPLKTFYFARYNR
ncbi:MAG: cupin domain-containing protein [Candidatus Poribacteria bacterium]|nr:cupin domain-containing protein [Candidatus Poribacteria bacterium]